MACIIWKSKKIPQINLPGRHGNEPYEHSVPTYIENVRLKEFMAIEGFEEYDPKEHTTKRGQYIYVVMPREPEWFFVALRALDKIQKNHPSCDVQVQALPEYAAFLTYSNCVTHRDPVIKYYRDFNLSEHANILRQYNRSQLAQTPWPYLLMDKVGLHDVHYEGQAYDKNFLPIEGETVVVDGDDLSKPYRLDFGTEDSVLIIMNGDSDFSTVPGLGDELIKIVPDNTVCLDWDEKEKLNLIKKIARPYKAVISCGDSPMVIASLICGHKTIAFVPTEVIGKPINSKGQPKPQMVLTNTLQYKDYDNFIEGKIGGQSMEEVAKMVVQMVKAEVVISDDDMLDIIVGSPNGMEKMITMGTDVTTKTKGENHGKNSRGSRSKKR